MADRRARWMLALAALLVCCSRMDAGDLGAALPDARENLIEASCNYFGELGIAGPFVDPPALKLYRDGTMVFKRDGRYFEGRVPEEELRVLELRLAESELLRRSTYLEGARGRGLLHHGGFCHLRYLDGEESRWIVATVDPAKRSWRRLVERLEAARPADVRPFLPASLKISVRRQAGSPHQEWPHAAVLDLEAVAGTRLEVSDLEVIRTLLTLPHRSFSHAGGAYFVRVLGAPSWYDAEETARRLASVAQLD